MYFEPRFTASASAAFTIVGELMRFLPSSAEIHPRITNPGGGQYECLSLLRGPESANLADFNILSGGLHIHRTDGTCDTNKIERWPQRRNFFLAAMTQGYSISDIAEDVLTAIGFSAIQSRDKSAGLNISAIGLILGRFAYECGAMVENGWRNQHGHSEWLDYVPEDWESAANYSVTAGQFWRVSYRNSVIFDDCEAAYLVEKKEMLNLPPDSNDPTFVVAINRIEQHLRSD